MSITISYIGLSDFSHNSSYFNFFVIFETFTISSKFKGGNFFESSSLGNFG